MERAQIIPLHPKKAFDRRLYVYWMGPILLFFAVSLPAWQYHWISTGTPLIRQAPQMLNAVLPDPELPSDAKWDKMYYYKKADSDSARDHATLQEDLFGSDQADKALAHPGIPLNGINKAAGSSSGPQALQGAERMGGPARRPLRDLKTSKAVEPAPEAAEITRKLEALQQILREEPAVATRARSHDTPEAVSDLMPQAQDEAPEAGSPEPPEPDPELAQLSQIMDKILAVQHPDMVADSLEKREKDLPPAYRVTRPRTSLIENGTDPVLAGPSRNLQAGTVTTETTNRFYSLEEEDSLSPSPGPTLKAVVPESQTLTSGSALKLRLTEDCNIGQLRLPAGTLLYGTSRIEGERMRVTVTSILSEDQIIPVSLEAYDLDGLRGIHLPGGADRQTAKNSGAGAIASLEAERFDPSLSARIADAGIHTAKTMLTGRIRQRRVRIKEGYRLLLKNKGG